jgi:putative tryptophan/tyrosine transport system substrate-binding protein
MRRRKFLRLIGGATAAWPLAVTAQPSAMPVIGFLSGRSPAESASVEAGFRTGLKDAGYVEGQNLHIAFRWADGQYERLPALAADLVDRRVAVIVAVGSEVVALAAKAATTAIPIVFVIGSDPVEVGLVVSLNRPGGNITGTSLLAGALGAKRLELLRELVPGAGLLAFLMNPRHPRGELDLTEMRDAALSLGQNMLVLTAATEADFPMAFATLVEQKAGALIVNRDAFFNSRREQIIALAARHAVPSIYESREHVAAGGLISYGPSYSDTYRQAGIYAGRILRGAKPTDLPVQLPTKFELAINIKTARALGVDVPPTLLARADDVVE